ncbi:MAG: rhodanese-like domain-containing protein [Candidatus Riflebacteria bacterium]|nr:rhodanese-like domain-containing protein [Candidatus Riflebacteria bacterium]
MPRSSITADTLVNLMNSGAKVSLVECRSGEQKEDLRIPGAIIARDNESEETILARLPSKDTMLILYPGLEGGNIASMTESLRKLGYLSILEYRDGVYGWITFGYEPAKGELP